MSDYKWAAQVRAEELAEEQGQDYFSLPQDKQCELYQQGLDDTFENLMTQADLRNDSE